MSKQPHTEFRYGQKVMVHLRSGSKIVAKYTGKYRNGIKLEGHKIDTQNIRQVSIYKNSSPTKLTTEEE